MPFVLLEITCHPSRLSTCWSSQRQTDGKAQCVSARPVYIFPRKDWAWAGQTDAPPAGIILMGMQIEDMKEIEVLNSRIVFFITHSL